MPEAKVKQAPRVTVQRLSEMGFAFKQSGTLLAAIELDLFTPIFQGKNTLGEIARAVGARRDAAERLLSACLSLKLVEKRGPSYYNAPDVERFLVKNKSWGRYLLYQARSEYDQWKNITSALLPPDNFTRLWRDPRAVREFIVASYNANISAAHKLAREYDLSKRSLLLDLGGGSACFCIAACKANPRLRAIDMDHRSVLDVAKEFVEQEGLSGRITLLPGDYLTDPYPQGADVILLSTTLVGKGRKDHELVFKKAFKALQPGGGIILHEYWRDEAKPALEPAFRHLSGLLGRSGGSLFSTAQLSRMMKRAGFAELQRRELVPGTTGLITAQKPA